MQTSVFRQPFKVPANTCRGKSFIHSSCLPKGIQPNLDRSIHVSTLTGEQTANRSVVLQGITLPERPIVDRLPCLLLRSRIGLRHDRWGIILLPKGLDFLLSIRSMKWHEFIGPRKLSNFSESIANETHCFFVESDLKDPSMKHFRILTRMLETFSSKLMTCNALQCIVLKPFQALE